LQRFMTSRYPAFFAFAVGLTGVLLVPIRLSDNTYEAEVVGMRWLQGSEILYAQVWSKLSPQTLFLGSVYHRFVWSNVVSTLLEIVVYMCTALLLYGSVNTLFHGKKYAWVRANAYLLYAVLLAMPGMWQRGIYAPKIGLLLLSAAVYTYIRWKSSGPSYWLLGPTTKNWRLLLACGVAATMLINTSLLYGVFLLPILVDFVVYSRKKSLSFVRLSGFFVVPFVVEMWVWYAAFGSHGVLNIYAKFVMLELRNYFGSIPDIDSLLMLAMIPLTLVVAYAVAATRSKNIRAHPGIWATGIVLLAIIVFAHANLYFTSLLFVPLLPYITPKSALYRSHISYILLAIIVSLVPATYLLRAQTSLDSSRARAAAIVIASQIDDAQGVYYYGRGSGYYHLSDTGNSTGFYDALDLQINSYSMDISAMFRGDSEANPPQFVIYATGERSKIYNSPERLEQYFAKHYEKVATLDDYIVLKRK
jgi:hypothetical protein